MAGEVKKSGKMTVFRTDRHEDLAAMVLVGCLVVIVLGYMAFIVPTVTVGAPSDGKVVAKAGDELKKGKPIVVLEHEKGTLP